jgi:hypothetical protein
LCAADFHVSIVSGLRCVGRLICFRRVYVIDAPNKDQQVYR